MPLHFKERITAASAHGLEQIRELIFKRLLLAFIILGFIAYVPSVVLAVINELWLITIVDTIAYLLILFFAVKSSVKTEIKVLFVLLISLGIGVVLLVEVGPFGAGYFWIFAVPIIAAVLLEFRYSIAALIINFFLMVILGYLQYTNVLEWSKLYSFETANWLILSVNFLLLNIGATLSLAVLIKRLELSLKREKEFAKELVKDKEELIKAKSQAEKANRLKTEFLAQMSHEIRSPINTIMSYVSLLKEEISHREEEHIHDSFRMIELGSMRITRTIESILNMSEMQVGSYEPKFVDVNICYQILKPLFSEFKLNAVNKSLDYRLNLEHEEFVFNCDVYSMTQLFANLIDNAIKYTMEGQVIISSSFDKQGRFYVSVSDSGIGMSDSFQERLFEPFSQEEQGYSRRFKGTGLGLSLVKKYAEINNVKINVASKKDEGTVFLILFA